MPAASISSQTILFAFLHISTFSLVRAPTTRTPSPGPGKGCLYTVVAGKSNSSPISLTSSLYKSRIGSHNSKTIPLGRARLW